jgi:FG-GAP-like repeat
MKPVREIAIAALFASCYQGEPLQLASPCIPGQLSFGDFDADGRSDIVARKTGVLIGDPDFVCLSLNEGERSIELDVLVGDIPPSVADVDADGDLDVITVDGSEVHFSLNEGEVFTDQLFVNPLGEAIQPRAFADFDGDGDIDVFAFRVADSSLQILLNQGDGTLSAQAPFSINSRVFSVQVADLDGDGDSDLLGDVDLGVQSLFNQGDGTFEEGSLFEFAGGSFRSSLVDLDADGDQDLTGFTDSNEVFFAENDGAGSFTTSVVEELSFRNGRINDAVAGDIDGDGLPELLLGLVDFDEGSGGLSIYGPSSSSSVVVFSNKGALKFSKQRGFPVKTDQLDVEMELFLQDLNADSLPELITASLTDSFEETFLVFSGESL